MLKSKRGFGGDIIFIPVMLFVVAVVLFTAFMILDEVVPELEKEAGLNTSIHQDIYGSSRDLTASYDFIFLAILMALAIGLILTSAFLPASPIFFIIYIFIMVVSLIISAMLANTYTEFSESAEFAVIAQSFPISNFVMNNFPLYVLVIVTIAAVVLYAKVKVEGGGGER